MHSYVLILSVAFFGTAWTLEICPVSVDAETSEIKINAAAFPNFGRPCEDKSGTFPGPKGSKGSRGPPGPLGLVGPTGKAGAPGRRGNNGVMGREGPKGDKGEVGMTGPKGIIGVRGRNGLKGNIGQKGNLGQKGLPGRDTLFPETYEKRMRNLEDAVAYLGKSWRTIGQYRVWFSEASVSFREAEKLCQSIQGRLAAKSIRDNSARRVIYEITKEKGAEFWIGLNDIHREGSFVWSDGVAFTQTHLWKVGQPDNASNEDCINTSDQQGQLRLNDLPCGAHCRIICEQDV